MLNGVEWKLNVEHGKRGGGGERGPKDLISQDQIQVIFFICMKRRRGWLNF